MVEMKRDMEDMTGQKGEVCRLLNSYIEKFGDIKDEKGEETTSAPA